MLRAAELARPGLTLRRARRGPACRDRERAPESSLAHAVYAHAVYAHAVYAHAVYTHTLDDIVVAASADTLYMLDDI